MQTWNKLRNRCLLCCCLDVLQISTISPGLSAWQEDKEDPVLWNKPLRQLRLSAIALRWPKYKMRAAKFPDTLTAVWKMDVTGCVMHATETVRLRDEPQREKEKKKKSSCRSHFHMHGAGVWEQTAQWLLCHLMCCKVKLQLLVLSADGNTCCFESELGAHCSNYEILLWMYLRLHFELFLYSVLQVCAHVSSLFIWLFKVLFSFMESYV